MKKGVLNLGLNEIFGNVTFGEGCIINPTCSIVCEKKDEKYQIIFGDYNVIEERAVIVLKPNQKDHVIRIGSYNIFGIKSYVTNSSIGDGNVIQARAEIRDSVIGNYNIIGSDTRINKKNIGSHYRIFYPGIMKEIDVIDQERTRENVRELFTATKALFAKEKQ